MSGNGSIQNLVTRDKTFLGRTDKLSQKRLESIHKELGKYFVDRIIEAYRLKVLHAIRVR